MDTNELNKLEAAYGRMILQQKMNAEQIVRLEQEIIKGHQTLQQSQQPQQMPTPTNKIEGKKKE